MSIVRVVNAPSTDDAFLWLLTFNDPNSQTVLRAVNDLKPVTSRGDQYEPFPFDVRLPPDDGSHSPAVQIIFPHVGRELGRLVREHAPHMRPIITMELILASNPDLVEKRIDFLEVNAADYDAAQITFSLSAGSIFGRKANPNIYDQAQFPGIFWSIR